MGVVIYTLEFVRMDKSTFFVMNTILVLSNHRKQKLNQKK